MKASKGQPVLAVDKGVLKTFLMSRRPSRAWIIPTGTAGASRGDEVVSRQSNLIVESSNAVSDAKLRQMLIDEVKKQNKPYGLVFPGHHQRLHHHRRAPDCRPSR
jgi:TldD protein